MGKRGPKPQPGQREPNGRLKRSAVKQIEEADRLRSELEMKTVLAQPHRKGSTNQLCASAFGRFVLDHKLRSEVYYAGNQYAELVNCWRCAKGIPTLTRQKIGGRGNGPSDETVKSWGIQIGKIELAIVHISHSGYLAMRRLCLDDEEIPQPLAYDAIIALGALAIALGKLPNGGHPFLFSKSS